eukprot:sb/3473493/
MCFIVAPLRVELTAIARRAARVTIFALFRDEKKFEFQNFKKKASRGKVLKLGNYFTVVIRHNCHVSTWVSTRISTWKSRRSANDCLLTTVLCAAHWHVHLGRWQAFTCYECVMLSKWDSSPLTHRYQRTVLGAGSLLQSLSSEGKRVVCK